MALDLRDTAFGVTLRVRVQPRAARDAIGGLDAANARQRLRT